jgi:hypothetical protein
MLESLLGRGCGTQEGKLVRVRVGCEPLSSEERITFIECEAYGVLRATIEGERRYTTRSPALTPL